MSSASTFVSVFGFVLTVAKGYSFAYASFHLSSQSSRLKTGCLGVLFLHFFCLLNLCLYRKSCISITFNGVALESSMYSGLFRTV